MYWSEKLGSNKAVYGHAVGLLVNVKIHHVLFNNLISNNLTNSLEMRFSSYLINKEDM